MQLRRKNAAAGGKIAPVIYNTSQRLILSTGRIAVFIIPAFLFVDFVFIFPESYFLPCCI
jgi:hypothetical protein